MVRSLKSITGVGKDIRQIAKLLQAKAPPGHKLAYINEEEARLLKSRGGSGRITETGIPSYEIGDSPTYYSDPTSDQGQQAVAPEVSTPTSASVSAPDLTTPTYYSDTTSQQGMQPVGSAYSDVTPASALGSQTFPSTPSPVSPDNAFVTAPPNPTDQRLAAGTQTTPQAPTDQTQQKQDQGTLSKLGDYLTQPKTLTALGLGGAQALIAANQVKKAQQQGQQASQAQQALAAPYQAQGQQLQAQATQGSLTPANQQILQAAQAQAAQGVANRGGVGSMQAQQQIAALTQNLLANQMNLGLQMQQLGDKIAIGAIQSGVQADQYVNQLTANYAQNIARTVAGVTGGYTPPTTTTTTTGGQ